MYMLTEFNRIFPAPRYLKMPHAGIHVSDEAIYAVEYKATPRGYEIKTALNEPLPTGAIESGYIHDPKPVQAALEKIKKQLSTNFIAACLPEEKMYLFRTEVPAGQSHSEIRQNIEFKLEENVPISPAEALFDFELIPDTHEASVSVVPIKVVDAYKTVFENAGYIVTSFNNEAKAISRAVFGDTEKHNKTYVILHSMGSKTGIYVVSRGVVCFTSTVPYGGNSITDAIAKAFNVSREEALKIKKEKGATDTKESRTVFEAASNTISVIKDELVRVIQYWESHEGKLGAITSIVLCGHDTLITGFSAYITRNTNIPAEMAHAWNAIDHDGYVPHIERVDSLDYVSAAGLAL